jgi:hypothetical protein
MDSLVISKSGSGTVISSPAGIACGTTCGATFTTGTNVTLTATPDLGAVFTGWSGGVCSGTATTCQVTMDGDKTVTATFLLKGDINLDGIVNLSDAILIIKIVSHAMPIGTIEKDTDVNADGMLNLSEAIYIFQKAANLR